MGRAKKYKYQNIEFVSQNEAKNLRKSVSEQASTPDGAAPQLARRRQNRKSTIRSGRTIGEQRERLETASERQAAHQKAVRQKRRRIVFVTLCFIVVAACPVALYYLLVDRDSSPLFQPAPAATFEPTIEIVDTDSAAGSEITTRMKNYIGQAEADFRDLGYTPVKAVLPSGAVREVDFYLKDQPGYIKMLIDRDTAPSVEDADRLLRHLKSQNIEQFEYLDVRLEGKAFWK